MRNVTFIAWHLKQIFYHDQTLCLFIIIYMWFQTVIYSLTQLCSVDANHPIY